MMMDEGRGNTKGGGRMHHAILVVSKRACTAARVRAKSEKARVRVEGASWGDGASTDGGGKMAEVKR